MSETGQAPAGVTRWRKRPAVVEAVQWTGDNLSLMQAFCGPLAWGDQAFFSSEGRDERLGMVWNERQHGYLTVQAGDLVIRAADGLTPVSAEDYEPVSSAGTPEDRSEASQLVYEYDESEPGEITNGWVARAAGVLREIADPAGGQVMVSRQDLRDLLTMTGIHAPLMAKTSGVVDRLSAAAGES